MKQLNKHRREGSRLLFSLWIGLSLFAAAPAIDAPAAAQSSPTAPLGAQPGKGLTMDEAVRIALENHSSIKSAQYQVKAQDAVVHQQMAAYYPTITLNNAYATENGTSPARSKSTGTAGGSSGGGGGIRGVDAFAGTAEAKMTLYNFGKREASVQSARETLGATEYGYQATANNIVLAVKQAFLGVLQANALLNVNEETVKDREVTLRQTQGFYDVGTKPRSDVTQAEANLYIAQANLISARNGVDVAWATLRNAMGVDDYSKEPLAEDLTVPAFTMTLDEAKQAAFAARPELLQFKALLRAQDQLIAGAQRNYLPDFDFDSVYGRQAKTFEAPTPNWKIALNLNFTIFNGFQTSYQVQQALATYRSIKEQERVERQQVAFQVEQSYLNLNSTEDAIRANEAAVKAAKENLELHEGRYEVGYAPIVEVTDAQTTYTTAQTNYVNALIAHKSAMVQLANAMGTN